MKVPTLIRKKKHPLKLNVNKIGRVGSYTLEKVIMGTGYPHRVRAPKI